jgi:hypothetical protein
MLADWKEEYWAAGTGARATASSVGIKTAGVLTTICEQQQKQASPEAALSLLAVPEISQFSGAMTSQAINSTPVSRRRITAAIRKIVSRDVIA